MLRRSCGIAIAVASLLATLPASAQPYPSRTVRIVVPFAAAGTGDFVARVIADKLAGRARPIGRRGEPPRRDRRHRFESSRVGDAGRAYAAAWPDRRDGDQPALEQRAGLDPVADLAPIALATIVPLALVAPGKASYSTVAEMIAASKTRGLSFASAGAATPGHLSGELLKLRTKSNMTHVPYNGAGPALNDILGGHVDLFFSGFPPAVAHVKAGNMKLLAVSTAKRSGVAADVPTVAEASGIKDFDIALWQGFFAPRGTPKEIVTRLHKEINRRSSRSPTSRPSCLRPAPT